MKRIEKLITSIIFIACLFLLQYANAQSPNKMSYQAVIRDASNNLVTNQSVGMQISIVQGTANGTVVYSEIQNPTTNANGLVTLEIGTGTTSGNFATIDWLSGPYFIRTETDPTGGTTYTITGTSQLMSVPYALYAANSGSSIPGPQGPQGPAGADGVGVAQTLSQTGNTITLSDGGGSITITDTDTQLDSTGVTALGFVSGAHTVDTDTQLDETAVDAFVANNGYLTTEVDGSITNEIELPTGGTNGQVLNTDGSGNYTWVNQTTDTQLDSTGVTALGFVSGAHTVYTEGAGIDITNNMISATGNGAHYLGEEFGGGFIFYLYIGSDGVQHGLILNKNVTFLAWEATPTFRSDRDPSLPNSNWDGTFNTGLMNDTGAAAYVNGLSDGGFTDWYLPSILELRLLWQNLVRVNKVLSETNGLSPELGRNDLLWSSTIDEYSAENGPPSPSAYTFNFRFGTIMSSTLTNSNQVRAIRAF